jgi:hypothetical protein
MHSKKSVQSAYSTLQEVPEEDPDSVDDIPIKRDISGLHKKGGK